MYSTPPLKVVIDARITPEVSGGAALALVALVRALGRLPDGDETYQLVVASSRQAEFWGSVATGRVQLVDRSPYDAARAAAERRGPLGSLLRPWEPIIRHVTRRAAERRRWPDVRISNGFYESLGCDVLHFPWQDFEVCALPTVFNPHDLQHLHYPQFFGVDSLIERETVYPAACHFARTIIVGSAWAKDDVLRQYSVAPDKVQVIPEGASGQLTSAPDEATVQRVVARYQLTSPFLLYPAISWPHKNHVRLLQAIAHLRDESGQRVSLVCTGSKFRSFWPTIETTIRDLGLESQVSFLGFVPEEDLRAIQSLAHALVLPSLFEASSLPIYEAWMAGVPVASSNTTALPGQVGDAGLLFDPLDVGAMADAMARIMTDDRLRDGLRRNGYTRLQDFDWERTARCYRAVYRRVAGRLLNDEDRRLLSWDWAAFPERSHTASLTGLNAGLAGVER